MNRRYCAPLSRASFDELFAVRTAPEGDAEGGEPSAPVALLISRDAPDPTVLARWIGSVLAARVPGAEGRQSEGGGRGEAFRAEVGGRRLVLRRSLRGGLIRHLSRARYLRPSLVDWEAHSRPWSELRILAYLRGSGVSVPEPVAAGVRPSLGGLAYEGAVIMGEVPHARSLFELSQAAGGELKEAAVAAGAEAGRMLRAGVFHQDLHPGNVLWSGETPVLIDFDNALLIRDPAEDFTSLTPRLAARWRRAVEKYKLPPAVALGFEEGLAALPSHDASRART